MLIINADDFGRDVPSTEKSLFGFKQGLITSASAMVFMKNSQAAAEAAPDVGLETGLHLNLTLPFDGSGLPSDLREKQGRIIRYLRSRKWAQALYNPFLNDCFKCVYQAQHLEYLRLYGTEPVKIDGHHHMHLCMNMIFGHLMPRGSKLRRNQSFETGEKGRWNRFYRRGVDRRILRRYICADYFFGLESFENRRFDEMFLRLAQSSIVELEIHPDIPKEYDFLTSARFSRILSSVWKGTYGMIGKKISIATEKGGSA